MLSFRNYNNKIFDFFFKERSEDYGFFLAFRCSIGLFCIVKLLSIAGDFGNLYSTKAIIDPKDVSTFKPYFLPSFADIEVFLSEHIQFSTHTSIVLFYILFLALCVMLIVGLFTRFSAITLLCLHLILAKGSPLYSYGVDFFTSTSLFYCSLFPLAHSRSLDKKIYKLPWVNPSPYRKILQVHLCIVYFFGGLDKIAGTNWRNGESLWKALHMPLFDSIFHTDYNLFISFPILPRLMGWFVIFIELFYSVFIWWKPTRKLWLLLIVSMHIGILIFLGLINFSILLIILNLNAFLTLRVKKVIELKK